MAKQQKSQRYSSVKWFLLFSFAAFLLLPCTLFAEPLLFIRTVDEIDTYKLSEIKKIKLSAALKTDKKGNMVIRCLNLFTIPVAQKPFEGSPGLQKLAQRTQLQVEQKGRAVFVKLAVAF
jgi:hypothetical protein